MKTIKKYLQRFYDFLQLNQYTMNSIKPSLEKILKGTLIVSIIIFICILIFFTDSRSYVFFTVLTIMAAFYLCGSIIGFIFAVPKSFQNNTAPAEPIDGKRDYRVNYKDNTSLEEISDWITKIIIGLSLTQFHHLQKMVYEAAKNISIALITASESPATNFLKYLPFCYALIILYSAFGITFGYLWTRVEFPKILRKKDDDLEVKLEVNRSIIKSLNNPNDHQFAMEGLVQTEKSINPQQIEIMNSILLGKGNSPDKDDPQKGRWGGKSISNNRQINAEVKASIIPGLYKVKIIVSSIDKSPINSPIGIILHDSFEPMLRILDPKGSSEAFVEIIAYESFTVGALTDVESDKIYNQLELDLNEVPFFPPGFYWK